MSTKNTKNNNQGVFDIEECFGRLKIFFGVKTDKELAEKLKMSPQNLNNRKQMTGSFPFVWVASAAKEHGISLDWILFGEKGEKHSPCFCLDEFSLIPLYKARLSCGDGSLQVSDETETAVAFRNDFLHRKGNSSHLCLLTVEGDSMSPSLNDGDVVLVDLSKNNPLSISDGKIYAFRERHEIKAKRLSWLGNKLRVNSDNKMYDPYFVEDISGFVLFGLVLWVGHEF